MRAVAPCPPCGRYGFDSVISFSWADSAGTCKYDGRGATGDYGMVSYKNDNVTDGTPTPQMYAYALWRLAAGETLVNATIAQGSSTKIKAYPSTFADGALGLVLVNEDAAAHTVRLASSISPKLATAFGWVVGSSEPKADDPLEAAGVTWNGEASPAGGLFPLQQHLVSYSLTAAADGMLEFDVPGYSFVGLVGYPASAEAEGREAAALLEELVEAQVVGARRAVS